MDSQNLMRQALLLLLMHLAWLKRHHPEIFAASLLNSQPMGFYTSAQIINDCLARNVEIKPIDIKKAMVLYH